MLAPVDRGQGAGARAWRVGRLSLAFLLDQASSGVAGLGVRDALLVLAVNQANIAPLTRERAARESYGALESPAPDSERRPVSMSAVAASLRMPFETARRRLARLLASGVIAATEGGVIVPQSFLASERYLDSVRTSHLRLARFYADLHLAGLLSPLPPALYDVSAGAPVRAAARLLSDWVLRTADLLLILGGDLPGTLLLVAIAVRTCDEDADEHVLGCRPADLSRTLQIPAETTRRRIATLVANGLVARVGGRVRLAETAEALAQWDAFFRENGVNVQRLFAALAERGLVAAWMSGASSLEHRREGSPEAAHRRTGWL